MKALVIPEFGGPELLQLREMPDPQSKPGEVLVSVRAAGINFADLITARGGYPNIPKPPLIAGREFAGVREDTGERVMGYIQWGAFADKVAAQLFWPSPATWSDEEAAAFPVNFFTAYLAYWKAGLADASATGKRVLIHAAAGGVGTAAVEIGKILGIETYGTSSSDEKLARVGELGLTHPINYEKVDYEKAILKMTGGKGVDAVFEMLGGEHTNKSVRCLAEFGSVIQFGSASGKRPEVDARMLYVKSTSVHGLWLSVLSRNEPVMKPAWERLSQWISQGKLRPVIGQVLPMDKAADGYRLLQDRKNFGKVVLKITDLS
jgi:NADPH:quinone reductase